MCGDRIRELDQGIAGAEQLFRSTMVKDDLTVLGRCRLERDPAGHIGLDQTGDDVDGGALRGKKQVDSGSSSELGDAYNGLLHGFAVGEHEVGELVDDDHDAREQALGARDALALHDPVSTVHELAQLLQLGGSSAHVGYDRAMQEIAQAIPPTELHLLGVDHDKAAVVGRVVEANGADNRIDQNGLARTGRTGDERVGHAGEVEGEHAVELGYAQQRGEGAVIPAALPDELREMHGSSLVSGDLEGEVGLRTGYHDDLAVQDRG